MPFKSRGRFAATVLAAFVLSGCGMGEHANVRAKLMPQFDDIDVPEQRQDVWNPESPVYGLLIPDGWATDPVVLHFEAKVPDSVRAGVLNAVRTWNEAIGFPLLTFGADHSEAEVCDLYSRLDDKVSTISVSDDWACTGKPSMVLGTTIWDADKLSPRRIATSDIVLNTEHYVIGDALVEETDGYREVVDAETLALHELGHLLGLGHIQGSVDANSVMSATVFIGEGLANRRISAGDVERVRRIYRGRNQPDHSPRSDSESGG